MVRTMRLIRFNGVLRSLVQTDRPARCGSFPHHNVRAGIDHIHRYRRVLFGDLLQLPVRFPSRTHSKIETIKIHRLRPIQIAALLATNLGGHWLKIGANLEHRISLKRVSHNIDQPQARAVLTV